MVAPQKDMDKIAAMRRHGADIMFVGDDWRGTPEWIALEKDMGRNGMRIMYFSYTKHISSSKLRKIVKK